MNTISGTNFKMFLKERQPVHDESWDEHEPANMVVALGDNPISGEKERFPKNIPLAKLRPKDDRSILVFNVELDYVPYISPLSGGVAYSVKDDGLNTITEQTGKWVLKEVHLGECSVIGEFVGVLLYFEALNKTDYVYYQWRATKDCPPIFYGWYPEKWLELDPRYIKLHRETKRLAQMSSQYELCDKNMCCVRHGCEVVYCKSIDLNSGIPCHKKECCINHNNKYESLLQKWIIVQQKAYKKLFEKIANPIPEIQKRVISDEFIKFSKAHVGNEQFWLEWTKSVVNQESDFQFITDWKIQMSRDESILESIKAFKKAERKWKEILKKKSKEVPSIEELKNRLRSKRN